MNRRGRNSQRTAVRSQRNQHGVSKGQEVERTRSDNSARNAPKLHYYRPLRVRKLRKSEKRSGTNDVLKRWQVIKVYVKSQVIVME